MSSACSKMTFPASRMTRHSRSSNRTSGGPWRRCCLPSPSGPSPLHRSARCAPSHLPQKAATSPPAPLHHHAAATRSANAAAEGRPACAARSSQPLQCHPTWPRACASTSTAPCTSRSSLQAPPHGSPQLAAQLPAGHPHCHSHSTPRVEFSAHPLQLHRSQDCLSPAATAACRPRPLSQPVPGTASASCPDCTQASQNPTVATVREGNVLWLQAA